MLEQSHEGGGLELIVNVILERQMEEKGDSRIPDKFPAIVIFEPNIFVNVMPLTTGSAFGSYLSSG